MYVRMQKRDVAPTGWPVNQGVNVQSSNVFVALASTGAEEEAKDQNFSA